MPRMCYSKFNFSSLEIRVETRPSNHESRREKKRIRVLSKVQKRDRISGLKLAYGLGKSNRGHLFVSWDEAARNADQNLNLEMYFSRTISHASVVGHTCASTMHTYASMQRARHPTAATTSSIRRSALCKVRVFMASQVHTAALVYIVSMCS
jgi:hypothetical protein